MNKIVVLLLVLTLVCCSSLAEGKLKATEKNLFVYANDDNGYFYAKIENVGDAPIASNSGDLVIFSDDDEIVTTESYVTTLPSYTVIEPGEYLYVKEFLWDAALKDAVIGDYKFSLSARDNGTIVTKIPCEATFELSGVDSYDNYVYVTFTNTATAPLYDCYITAALHDADGTLVFVDSISLSSVAVHPDSTITVKIYVDRDLMEHYQANNIVPTTVDAMVLYSEE